MTSDSETLRLQEHIAQLEQRIEYLEEQKRFTLDLLEAASSLGDFRSAISRLDDIQVVFAETAERIRRLLPVRSLGFFMVREDDNDIAPAHIWPESAAPALAAHVDVLIDKGVLAWAIREKRPVFMDGPAGERFLLHVLATSSRVRGMFVGEVDECQGEVFDYALALLSTLLLHSANALESFELYRWINRINADLHDKIVALAASEAELKEHRDHLKDIVAARTAELTDAVANLEASLAEKEILIKEVHHRVKNNLQIVSSLLSLQSRKTDDPLMREGLQEAQARIRSMAMIHENLYRANNLHSVGIKPYIEGLCAELMRTMAGVAGRVELDMDLEPALLSIDQAIPCGLALNEMLSNAFKHAFPEHRSGRISVAFGGREDTYALRVCDDGVGIKAGFDPQASDTLGFLLISTLAAQLGGRMEAESAQGRTCLSVIFPKGEAASQGKNG